MGGQKMIYIDEYSEELCGDGFYQCPDCGEERGIHSTGGAFEVGKKFKCGNCEVRLMILDRSIALSVTSVKK